MNIKEIRQKYPQYNDMSDVEFADAFHGKYYSDIPKEDFYKTLGVNASKTNLWEDVKSGFTGAANTLDTVATLGVYAPIAAAYRGNRVLPKIVDELNARKKYRTSVANPENKEQGLSGKLISVVPQILTSPLSPAETAQTFMDKGESSGRATAAGLIDAAGNAVGLVVPGLGGALAKRVIGGAGVNVAQEYVTRKVQQDIAEKKETKKAFDPTLEDLAVAGIIGGGFGALGKNKNKPKGKPPASDLNAVAADLEPPKAPIVPEQLELPLETSPQSIREMQTKGSPQMDLFEIANQPHERMPTRPDAVEPPAPLYEGQPELDFGPIEQDISTYRADQYGGGQGYGVLDENGVPIRADLSMEAANLENPLQRNLWGDELGPALDQQRSLTEAIDRMQETGRTAQGKFMPKEFLADTFGRELDTPVPKDMAREGPFSVERDPTATRPGQYMRSQRGAIDPDMLFTLATGGLYPLVKGGPKKFREGFVRANRALSNLTDQPWVKERFPGTDWMTNPDGTPAVLLHGTTADINGEVGGLGEGFHAGHAAVPHMFAGSRKRTADGQLRPKAHESLIDYTKGVGFKDSNGKLYPVAIKKGNYPHIDADMGSWNPEALLSSFEFEDSLGKVTNKPTLEIRSILDKYKNYILNQTTDVARNTAFSKVLKNEFGIDGFTYKNEGESTNIELKSKGQINRSRVYDNPKSFVTWDDNNFQSIYKEPTTPSYNRFGQGGGQTILNDIAGIAIDGFKKIKSLTSKSPEVVAAKEQLAVDSKKQRVQSIINGRDNGYAENITTPEAVIAAADGAKDITRLQSGAGKTVSPGINHLAIKTNNPLIKYMRAKTRDVFVEADRLTEKYITGQDGIGQLVQKLTPQEKVEVVQLLQLGDKKQTKITPELMKKHGFSENQIEFVDRFYEMDQVKLDTWNKSRAEAGMKPVTGREGHVPGIFKGDYKQLVLSPDGKPLGVIAVDSKWQLEAARNKMKEQFPDAKFSPMRRSNLGGSGSARSGEFGAMQEVLTMLAEKDPHFKEVQDMIAAAISENSDKAYGAAQHALRKKGIVGNEGNKPWLDPERNANDFIKAYLSHWEDQMVSHLALPVEQNVRALIENPALDGMENAKSYVDSYLKNMGGRGVGETGKALNIILDTPSRMTGFGPSATREAVMQFNKRMGQYSMGFGNMLFSITQWLQVAQTGMPELTAAAKQFGVPQIKVVPAMTKAMIDMLYSTVKDPSPELKATLDEAKARGLMTFSEFSDVSKISQSKTSATFDKIADFNRDQLGERPTRPLVFRAAVLMLKDSGLEGKALYDAAYNITQAGMFDYRMNERPMMYQKLGVTGQLAGGLQTFKHAYLGQLSRLGANGLKDPTSALLAGSALVVYSGIMGLPFYQELDQLFQAMTAKAGKRYTIAEYAMNELPRWLKQGAISDVTNINMQSRLSSADVLPNSPIEAVSPWASTVGRVGQAVGDVASFNDKLAWGNLGTQLAPQGPLKGMAERAFSTDDEGYVLNREGLRGNVRTDWDKNVRLYTGGRSLDEAITGENQYNSGQRLKGYRDKQKGIMEEIQREYVQGTLTKDRMAEYSKKYVESKGDPDKLVRDLINFAKTAKLDKQRRLQGIPNESLSTLYKFQEYQDDVEK